MQTAANILDSLIQDNITVTIQVGYGDWYNNYDTGLTTGAEGGVLNGTYVSYSTLRAALATHATSSLDQTLVNSLPATTSVNGYSSLWVSSAVEKALGLMSATAATLDGAVGIGTQISGSLLVGVALHELTHAMGRVPDNGSFDLVRYTSAGNHLFSTGATAPAAYFSIDGGLTKLADFGQSSDPSDFLNSGVQGSTDPFNEFYSWSTNQSLSTVDKQIMDAIGFSITPATPVLVESSGLTSLSQVGLNYSLATGGATVSLKSGGANVVAGQFGGWTPIGAEQVGSGFDIAWKVTGSDQYIVWSTDSSGNYLSSMTGIVSGASAALESFETTFHQDLNGDGTIGLLATTIESLGSTSLTQLGLNYYLGAAGSAPSLKYQGSGVTAGQFGGWAPIGAEQIGSGFDVAWKVTGSDQYIVWSTDGSGNYLSSMTGIVSGASAALESFETTFHQDLNGDGTIGLLATTIESLGSTSLTQLGLNYYLGAAGSAPSLKYQGSGVTAGQFGGWAPIGAEQVGSGFDVAWKVTGSDQYIVWSTDGSGNYLSSMTGIVSGASAALESFETTFHQDLNGDGTIGLLATTIESLGSTSLTQLGLNYYLGAAGSAPSLKYQGSGVTAGQFGGWAPIGAEQIGSGFDVAWKVTGSDQYIVWSTDGSGNYLSSMTGIVSGASAALESFETTFHQDLNGDGTIGVPPAATAFLTGLSSATSSFDGSTVTLPSGAGAPISATLIGFSGDGTLAGSHQVDLRGFELAKLQSSFDASSGVLSLSDGTHAANLQFLGIASQDSFKFANDGAGGTTVYVTTTANGAGAAPTAAATTLDGETFIFAPNFGQAALSHFDPATDTLQINHNVFANANAFLAAAHDDGGGNVVVVDGAHDTLSIQHVTLAQLQAHQNDLHFV
ncbi:hypothetical protein DB459_17325 [Bradyrhizobium sp. WD16]|nr:hypothetical protein DB459_17325 [Bradyrhizobium sp. WD16]